MPRPRQRPTRTRIARLARWLTAPLVAAGILVQAAAPASASSNIGGGEASGTVSFTNPGGVPPLFAPCAPTSFVLNGNSEAFALNTVITGYAGPVTLTGSGGSSCESASSGAGPLALTASGTGPTGSTILCNLIGGYTRVTTDVSAVLGGDCTVNNFDAPVSFAFEGQFEPVGSGAGISTPIYSASFQGAFTVLPA